MVEAAHCLALDFGASSIRLIDAWLADGRIALNEMARFANGPKQAGGRTVWDYQAIYGQIESTLRVANDSGVHYASIGADSWGVDYVLLGGNGLPLGPPVSYRDPRTDGQIERFTSKHIPARRLFELTGLQCLPFNTLYQLYAQSQSEPELLARARRLLFTADYVHYWLSGVAVVERTLASTSQMLTLDGQWSEEILAPLALNASALCDPVPAGTILGAIRPALGMTGGLSGASVIAPCTHDTQCAILSVPAQNDGDWAYLSSGTWSILGTESSVPFCGPDAEAAGLGNESGYDGTYCVQSTVSGLWLVQEIQRLLPGMSSAELAEQAEDATAFRSLVNPADERFFHPADMIAEIKAACRDAGEPEPETPGELARCAYDSLALLYRERLGVLSAVTGRKFKRLHVVGGGSQALLLNRLCACATGMPVWPGPAEATALGNAVAQMIALGMLSDAAEARAVIRASLPPVLVEPKTLPGLENAVARFERLIKEQ
ncbi:MAG TPA: rhamnulokinase family protein [Rhizomicrobium sp.]|nr:rhamnulokinase family protein [Rhizomicrobium sp.]